MPEKNSRFSYRAAETPIFLLILLLSLMACSHSGRSSSEYEKRQALSRDDLYTVEIANYETFEAAMTRLNELNESFPAYKNDLHITTIKKPDGRMLYALRSGVFIRHQEAIHYFEKFQKDTGLEESRLIDAE